ncbi:MAG: C40 family peptidase [Proteocatella sp.]
MKRKYWAILICAVYIFSAASNISYAEGNIDRTFKNLDSFISNLEKTYPNEVNNEINNSSKNNIIVGYAMQELGKPYVYGGSGPEVFDCSGLTSYVFSKAGITIPRVSYDQGNSGKAVDKNNMLPGDLVFFDTRNSNDFSDIKVDTSDTISLFELSTSNNSTGNMFVPQKVTHVGIYISDGKFIHASSGSEMKVVVSDLNNKYYNQRFLFAKRYE